ncbi:putative MSHA pilin protein MshA [Grimontia indica]|uniref:MSHA pilin protein MshA n=1 Tax=Grimontia indica TaxID=1056512 RepID=R1GQD7_9GAMM|nr:prepilin-type N-terminal cleavage/methylation domain-containing protein [Grimontia indica]EOD78304.1 putative MSHA pilin protein MshA [Grimontia indica]
MKGFTLIELLVVVIIMAVLAVTAAPKFVSFESQAKNGVLNEVKAAIQSAASMVNAKAILEEKLEKCRGDDSFLSNGIYTCFGYPSAHIDNFQKILNLGRGLIVNTSESNGRRIAIVTFPEYKEAIPWGANANDDIYCAVRYHEATAEHLYEIEMLTAGC